MRAVPASGFCMPNVAGLLGPVLGPVRPRVPLQLLLLVDACCSATNYSIRAVVTARSPVGSTMSSAHGSLSGILVAWNH